MKTRWEFVQYLLSFPSTDRWCQWACNDDDDDHDNSKVWSYDEKNPNTMLADTTNTGDRRPSTVHRATSPSLISSTLSLFRWMDWWICLNEYWLRNPDAIHQILASLISPHFTFSTPGWRETFPEGARQKGVWKRIKVVSTFSHLNPQHENLASRRENAAGSQLSSEDLVSKYKT